MKVKSAKLYAAAIYIDCPYCKQEIEHPETGSLLWDATAIPWGDQIWCSCGHDVQLPAHPKTIKTLTFND